MELRFAKMHGAANDFVVVEGSPPPAPRDAALAIELCDRRRGVGGDGILWMERLPDGEGPVFRMHFYNNDGSRCRMCFNGARCCARRARDLGWAGHRFEFATDYANIQARVSDREVSLTFPPPQGEVRSVGLPEGSPASSGFPVNTGDPHLVLDVTSGEFDRLDFEAVARPLRLWTALGDEGQNVHIVDRDGPEWRIRSFERGVEGETWACGSGCIASVLALGDSAVADEEIVLRTRGNDLIRVRTGADAWELSGPAVSSFEAVYRMEDSRA